MVRTTIVVEDGTMEKVKHISHMLGVKQQEVWAILVDRYYEETITEVTRFRSQLIKERDNAVAKLRSTMRILNTM